MPTTMHRISRIFPDRPHDILDHHRRGSRTDLVLSRYRRWVRYSLLQQIGSPTLFNLLGQGGARLADVRGFIRHLTPSAEIDEALTEFTDAQAEFETRRSTVTVAYEPFHDVEGESMLLCYALTRLLQPKTIVETGVANGASTFFFLRALSRNGGGVLHSFDIRDNVGSYLTKADRTNWDLQVLNRRAPLRDLARRLAGLSPIDLFIHDSHHKFRYMTRELELAATALSEHGIILCDDAESTFAFHKFCSDHMLSPTYVFDRTRFVGGVTLSQTPVSVTTSGGA